MGIFIEKKSIVLYDTDCIVNAANTGLSWGGGVCGAIFRACGQGDKLADECRKIGGCLTGGAVMTDSYNLPCKKIIHAVGPVWQGGKNNEKALLYSAYRESLGLLRDNGYKSIAFPLISAGIFGYPLKEAWEVALSACIDFLKETNRELPKIERNEIFRSGYDADIYFAAIDDYIISVGKEILSVLG